MPLSFCTINGVFKGGILHPTKWKRLLAAPQSSAKLSFNGQGWAQSSLGEAITPLVTNALAPAAFHTRTIMAFVSGCGLIHTKSFWRSTILLYILLLQTCQRLHLITCQSELNTSSASSMQEMSNSSAATRLAPQSQRSVRCGLQPHRGIWQHRWALRCASCRAWTCTLHPAALEDRIHQDIFRKMQTFTLTRAQLRSAVL